MPLPPIPIDSWIADQQDLLRRKIGGYLPALEFQAATIDRESEIPPDYPYDGGEDAYLREQEYIRQLEEQKLREEEEERRRQQLAAEEQARQQALWESARGMMAEAGIPSPSQMFESFQAAVGTRPGLGDEQATTGAFDPDQPAYEEAPAQQFPEYDLSGGQGSIGVSQPSDVDTVGDFRRYAQDRIDDVSNWMKPGGQVESTPGEPDSVTPRHFLERTAKERQAFSEAGENFTSGGMLNRGYGALQGVAAAANYLTARFDVVNVPMLTRTGILIKDLSPEEYRRFRELSTASQLTDAEGRSRPLTDAEFEELDRFYSLADQKYQRIKDDPDEVMRYYEAAPGSIIVPLATGLAAAPLAGRTAATTAARGATMLGAEARTAGTAGRYAGIVAESAVDPTTAMIAGPIETARGAKQAISSLTEPIGEGLRAADRLAGRAYDSLFSEAEPRMAAAIPPRVADALGFPVRVPTDPKAIGAIKRIGGEIDPDKGVTIYVVRSQSPSGAGQRAARGAVFYEATTPGGSGSGIYDNPDSPVMTGGSQTLPARPTRFRSPLFLDGAPGDAIGFNQAVEKLGIPIATSRATKSEVDAAVAGIRSLQDYIDEIDDRLLAMERATNRTFPESGAEELPSDFPPDAVALWREYQQADRALNELYARSQLLEARTPYDVLAAETRLASLKGKPGSSERAAALKAVVEKYGGDPDLVDDLLRIRGADSDESHWAIRENIVAEHARRKRYDGVITLKEEKATWIPQKVLEADPEYQAALDVETEAYDTLQRLEDAYYGSNYEGITDEQFQAARRAYFEAGAAIERVKEAIRQRQGTHAISELMDPREARNPTPPDVAPKRQDIQADVDRFQAAVDAAKATLDSLPTSKRRPGQTDIAWFARQSRRYREAVEQYTLLQSDLARHQERLAQASDEGGVVPPGFALRPDVVDNNREGMVRDAYVQSRQEYADEQGLPLATPPSVFRLGEMLQARTTHDGDRASELAVRSLPARTLVGAASGGASGAAAGDEDDTVGERAGKIALGAVGGGASLNLGTQAAARLVDSLIQKGALSSDVLRDHPASADRIRALFALAAKNLPDDATVDVPGMIRFITRAEPEVRAEVADLIDGPKTAGEIRELLDGFDPARLGREARDLIVDLLAGVGGRGRRGKELRADRATIEGLGRTSIGPGQAVEREATNIRFGDRVLPALDDADVTAEIHRIADELGIERPRIVVDPNPKIQAEANAGPSKQGNLLILSRGALDAGLSPEEFRALITHELAHTTEESFGAALLGRARELAGRVATNLTDEVRPGSIATTGAPRAVRGEIEESGRSEIEKLVNEYYSVRRLLRSTLQDDPARETLVQREEMLAERLRQIEETDEIDSPVLEGSAHPINETFSPDVEKAIEHQNIIAGQTVAEWTPDGLRVRVVRQQRPGQGGRLSMRGGSFYALEGNTSVQQSYARGDEGHGGPVRVARTLTLHNPYFVRASDGNGVFVVLDRLASSVGDGDNYGGRLNAAAVQAFEGDEAELVSLWDELDLPRGLLATALSKAKSADSLKQYRLGIVESAAAELLRRHRYDGMVLYDIPVHSAYEYKNVAHLERPNQFRLGEVFYVGDRRYPEQAALAGPSELRGARSHKPGPDPSGGPRLPDRGVWRERMQQGVQIPEGVPEHRANEIRRAYNEAMRLLAESQKPRIKARNQIRVLSRAHDAWERYEALLAGGGRDPRRDTGIRAPSGPRPRRDVQAADALGEAGDEGVLPESTPASRSRAPAEPASPIERDLVSAPSRTERVSEVPTGGRVADEIDFEPEALPDEIVPSQRIEQADVVRLLGQLADELVMDPALLAKVQKSAASLMEMPKMRMRHLQQLLDAVAERRVVARGKTKEEAVAEWTDEFLRKNGWLAPKTGDVPAAVDEGAEVLGRRGSRIDPDLADEGTAVLDEGPSDADLRALEDEIPELGRAGDDVVDEVPILEMNPDDFSAVLSRRVDPTRLPPGAQNDPRYQSRGQASAPKKVTNPGLFERIYNHWAPKLTDSVARLQGYQNDIAREFFKQTGVKLPVEALAAELKRLDANRMAEMDADRYMKPAVRIFRRLGFSDENINTYLSYKQDLDIVASTGNPTRMLPDGTDVATAQKWVDDWEAHQVSTLSAEQKFDLDWALQSVWDLGARILDLKREAGLINDEAFAAMRTAYPHYMPTRILDYINDDQMVGVGHSLSVTSNTIHAITQKGTERTALDSLPALYGALYEAHAAAQKNRVFNAFLEMWDAAKALPTTRGTVPVTSRGEQRVEEFANFILEKPPATHRTNEFVPVQGFVDGVKKQYWVHKDLGDVTKFETPVVIPLLSGLAAAFRAGATARNPIFLTANAFLDLSGYMIREMSRAGGPQHFFDVLGVYGATAGEFLLDPRRWGQIAGDIARHEYRGDMARFLAEGGGSSGLVGRRALRPQDVEWKAGKFDVDDLLKTIGWRQQSDLEQGIDRLGRGALEVNNAADFLRHVGNVLTLKPVEAIGERIELIPRVAAMRLAEKRGASQVESVVAGRTTTIDFNKGGTWARTVNQLIPFFNVGVQATADVQRAFKENPKAFAGTLGATIVAPMVLAEMWNQGDPQRKKDYDDVPAYLKDQGLVLMLPRDLVPPSKDAQGNEHPQFVHFRYRQFAPIAVLTREAMQRWYYDRASDEDKRGVLEMGLSAAGNLSPISASDPLDLATSLTPLGVQTGLQLGFDYDAFRGKRIKSEYADERASPLSKGLARGWNDLTGSDTKASQWEFGTRDIGTGYAGMLHGASEILFGNRKDEPSPQNIPGAGGLVGRVVKGSIGEQAERARQTTLTDSAKKILRDAEITWRPTEVDPEIRNIPLLRSEYARYQKEINKVTDEVIQSLAQDSGWQKMSKADKQSVLDTILSRRRDIVRRQFLATIPSKAIDERLDKARSEGKIPARSR